MHEKIILLQFTLLILTLSLFAQTSAPAEPGSASANPPPSANNADLRKTGDSVAPPSASIRVTTRMVLLDVVVTDNHERFVDGLTADQFSVAEDGVPQKIVFFSSSNAAKLDAQPRVADKQKSPVFTNRPDPSGTGSLVLILLDGVNTAMTDQIYARQQALHFLRTQLKPGSEDCGVRADE